MILATKRDLKTQCVIAPQFVAMRPLAQQGISMGKRADIISIADPDDVEAVIPHLHEVLNDGHSIKGIITIVIDEDGEQNIRAFGNVRARDIAYTGSILIHWAGDK